MKKKRRTNQAPSQTRWGEGGAIEATENAICLVFDAPLEIPPERKRHTNPGPVPLRAPVGFLVAVVPSPTGCSAGLIGRSPEAGGGRPGTGLVVPTPAPPPSPRGGGSGLGPRRTHFGPGYGVVPSGSVRPRSWAVCTALVCVRRPRHSRGRFPRPSVFGRGCRPVHRGFLVWTLTPPLASRRTPHPGPAHVWVLSPVRSMRLCGLHHL